MRAATQGKCVLEDERGVFYGFVLGFDFAAEHEWGIRTLRQRLGCDPDGIGAKARKITNPHALNTHDFGDLLAFWCGSITEADHVRRMSAQHSYAASPDLKGLRIGWDENSFMISSGDPAYINSIRMLSEAGQSGNLMTFLAHEGGLHEVNPFANSGLTITIYDRTPIHIKDFMQARDLDAIEIKKAVEETEIETKLAEAGMRYYALAPAWKDKKKGVLRFFLNPVDQHLNNFGWFSVQDLEEWIDGRGPIPKKRA